MPAHSPASRRPGEQGYMLVAVIMLLAIVVLSLSVAAPRVAREIQRDRELETMQRGKQYVRAIRLYYRKFNAYPPNVDALVKTQNIRFLRKKYVDLTTGKAEWKPVNFGQNKTPAAMGFFGQPLAGSTLAGTGPSGGNGVNGASNIGSSFMSGNNSATPSADSGNTGTNNTGTTTPGTASSASSSTTSSSTGSSTSPQTFGGVGIIGFSPNSTRQSILVFKKKNHYNEWEFLYDPVMERQMIPGGSGVQSGSATTANSMTNSATPNTPPVTNPN